MKLLNTKKLTVFSVLIGLAAFASSASAQLSNRAGTIKLIFPHVGNHVFFNLNVTLERSPLPACVGGANIASPELHPHPYRVDLTTETGQALYATLLLAAGQNVGVDVIGEGTCNGGRENVKYVVYRPQ